MQRRSGTDAAADRIYFVRLQGYKGEYAVYMQGSAFLSEIPSGRGALGRSGTADPPAAEPVSINPALKSKILLVLYKNS